MGTVADMMQRVFALDGCGVIHALVEPMLPPLSAWCGASPLHVVEGPLTCMACVGIEMHVETTAAYINEQLRGLVGQPVNGDSLGEIAARLLRPTK